jgi:dienelactone hydrolase
MRTFAMTLVAISFVGAAACGPSGTGGLGGRGGASGRGGSAGIAGTGGTGSACRPIEAVPKDGRACAGDLGDLVSGTDAWDSADLNNRECAVAGTRIILENPAVAAANATNVRAGDGYFNGDPFRAPHRWAGKRGSYERAEFTDRLGIKYSAVLLGPLDPSGGPYPGVVIVCHICLLTPTADGLPSWFWAAQSLAEAGYVVMYYSNLSNAFESAVDATDFFVATPENRSPLGEFNPWHTRLDRSRLAILGHSGAGGVALNVGLTDPRFDALVAWDPAPVFNLPDTTPKTPTMIQVAEYDLFDEEARHEKPTPNFPKFKFFDTISAAGVDTMQIAVRASRHTDWCHFPEVFPHGIFGEMVGLYYTLAWLDRYLVPSRAPDVASDALRRLTASGTDCFDSSADEHSIGAGFFDPDEARRTGNVEAGNVPIEIGGLPIRNLLSFQFESRYFLDGGALRCADMRAGCAR